MDTLEEEFHRGMLEACDLVRKACSGDEDLGFFPRPTAEQLHAAREVYRSRETRDADYWEAKKLVQRGFQENSLPAVAEGLELLLRSWNSQFHRLQGGFGQRDRRGIESLLARHGAPVRAFHQRSIDSLKATDYPAVEVLYLGFEQWLGDTGSAMALHLLAVEFFPLWDRRIQDAYISCLGRLTARPHRYFRFMRVAQCQIQRAGGRQAIGPCPLKILDEYNCCRYTKGWI